ncbi:hypothetical protein BGZ47_004994 [Haplosporangium gracile]|nr:hypothetical protein BGZ47_004994 [Haplosporangium gracile]
MQQAYYHNNDDNSKSHPLSATSRNWRWIRVLKLEQSLLQKKTSNRFIEHLSGRPSWRTPLIEAMAAVAVAEAEDEAIPDSPTGPELIFHLLQHCTHLQCLQIEGRAHVGKELESWRRILSTGIPRTITKLTLDMESQVPFVFSSLPPTLFSQCPSNLQELSLHIRYCYPQVRGKLYIEKTRNNGEKKPLPSLRVLRVTCQDGMLYSSPLLKFLGRCTNLESLYVSRLNKAWTGVLEACVHLKSLRLETIDTASIRLLADGLRSGLPSLDSIQIDGHCETIWDQDLANMFSACRMGWRSINVPYIDALSAEAIVQHYSTLEELSLEKARGLSSEHMLRILLASPRLKSFITLMNDDAIHPCIDATCILAADFIDADSSSDFLRSWACESTLTVFRARISGISRPDITQTFSRQPLEDGIILPQAYLGQGRDIQRRVYERLARLTRLERLELGHEDRNLNDYSRKRRERTALGRLDDVAHQYGCLEMSLKSGLQILEELKDLKVLSVMRMATKIGVEEVQWMVQSWPKLRRVDGLNCDESDEAKAHKWLRENHLRIMTNHCSPSQVYGRY